VREAGIGHVGLPMGCAEIGTVLFGEFLRHDPSDPDWPDRDRFVLSAGHGSMLLYSLLHLSGYALSLDDLRQFRRLGSITPGHPEHEMTPGVETTTGPLGQGLGNAVGMALSERILAARLGSEIVNHRTYALVSDGDLMEGAASEASSLAGHLGLGRLITIYDDNGVTIDGPASLSFSEDVPRRFEAYGWDVQQIDGHDPVAIRAALEQAQQSEDRPHLIACRTRIGLGCPNVGTSKAHGDAGMGDDQVWTATRENLGWTLPPFELPEGAGDAFAANASAGRDARIAWQSRLERAQADAGMRDLYERMMQRQLPPDLAAALPDFRGTKAIATRVASNQILNAVAARVPSLIGGSADLAGSNGTHIADAATVERGKFEGRNLSYGVREHGMAAIANGMALHGGLRPFVATFLVFSDYMRPAVRLAALMKQQVTFVFTHDSIFVGEDGPTHQPVEHVAALRTIPGLRVWRPADPRETVAAWLMALEYTEGPTALVLSRQALPVLEADAVEELARRGGYVVAPETGSCELVIVGTGSETSLAIEAARALGASGRSVRAVSVPCMQLFLEQDESYRDSVMPANVPRLFVEAGVEMGVAQLLRPGDRFHGMRSFGASANYKDLAVHFGFTAERVAEIAREMLDGVPAS
jgi:transketolase